jgi:adenylate cyclase
MNGSVLREQLLRLPSLGAEPGDSDEVRIQKNLMVVGSFMFIATGVMWGVAYIALGETLAGLIPLSYGIFSFLSFVVFAVTRRFRLYRFSQLVLILLLPFLLQLALGGYVQSSAVILWSLLCPLGALLFAASPRAWGWLVAYLGMLALAGLLQPVLRSANNLPQPLVTVFFILNLGVVSGIVFVLVSYFIRQRDEATRLLRLEQDRSEGLLLNILPREIAQTLKDKPGTIAQRFDQASVLFADMVGFTPLSAQMTPEEMVELLNTIYSFYDSLTEKYGLEKIRTIGDNYMVASGVPVPRPDHAQALACMALEMCDYFKGAGRLRIDGLNFRIGINSGPLVAGVIGHKKFQYDIWGPTVNTASRMESHGLPGKVQITQATYELLKDEFVCEPRGTLEVKGVGEVETWFLVGERERITQPPG